MLDITKESKAYMEIPRLVGPIAGKASLTNGFWKRNREMVADVTVPHCLDAVSGRLNAGDWTPIDIVNLLQLVIDKKDSSYDPFYCFKETDIYKTIEACAYLSAQGDRRYEEECDKIIDLLEKAQDESGYLVIYFQLEKKDKKLKNLQECHEIYTMGHMAEAAVAYYQATGKRKMLDIAMRFADYIDSVCGPHDSGKLYDGACDGHPEAEIALYRLYKCTGERRYLELSYTMIENRGPEPDYFLKEWERNGDWSYWFEKKERPTPNLYIQTHKHCRDMTTGDGHAVRAVYLYAAMANVGYEMKDDGLLDACLKIFDNITGKKMYVHGGIGANIDGFEEDFPKKDYDLPNYSYAETCAAVGMMVFCSSMFEIFRESRYMDTFEKVLYNNALSSVSQSGDSFFYANTLQRDEKYVSSIPWAKGNESRVRWYGLACCPPNITRFFASLPKYVYSSSEDGIYVNLYIGGEASFTIGDTEVAISQEIEHLTGEVSVIHINPAEENAFKVCLRIPEWAVEGITVQINCSEVKGAVEKGYLAIERVWSQGDTVTVGLPVKARRVYMPMVEDCKNKVALMYGPVLYAAEEIDNGKELGELSLPRASEISQSFDPELFGGTVLLKAAGYRNGIETELKFVPYYLWNNRGEGEMRVWINES